METTFLIPKRYEIKKPLFDFQYIVYRKKIIASKKSYPLPLPPSSKDREKGRS
jgi:hypothetical protein